MIYITSDLHFFHDREFIYKPRGFNSVEEMNNYYITQWLEKIKTADDIYIVGDFALGTDLNKISELLDKLPGKKHIIIGNHDTDAKINLYKSRSDVIEICYATIIKDKKRIYYLSHYPTLVAGLEEDPKNCRINLHGHWHTKQKFYEDRPYIINISVDANDNQFLTLADIENLFNNKVNECINCL